MRRLLPLGFACLSVWAAGCTLITDVDRSQIPDNLSGGGMRDASDDTTTDGTDGTDMSSVPMGDGAVADSAVADAAVTDGAVPDAAVLDGAVLDGAVLDGSLPDAAVLDGALPDAALLDAALPDAAVMDATAPDADGGETDNEDSGADAASDASN